jgi:hypothetical protein
MQYGRYLWLVGLVIVAGVLSAMVLQRGPKADTVDVRENQGESQVKILVSDEVGVPLTDGVSITLTSEETDDVITLTKSSVQDEEGYYVVAVSEGNYNVSASATGYKTDTQGLIINDGEVQKVNFYLEKSAE